jgi:hypothetical protein
MCIQIQTFYLCSQSCHPSSIGSINQFFFPSQHKQHTSVMSLFKGKSIQLSLKQSPQGILGVKSQLCKNSLVVDVWFVGNHEGHLWFIRMGFWV